MAAKKAANERKNLLSSPSSPYYGAISPASSTSTRVPSPEASELPTPDALSGASTPHTLVESNQPVKAPVPKSVVLTLLSKPHVRAVLASGFLLSFLGVGVEVVFVLYSYTRINLGGMGRSVCMFTYPSLQQS